MLFLIRFTDKPGTFATRQALLQAHCDWLAQRRDTVLVAGSLRVEPSAAPVGDAWTAGLRQSVEILHWSKALPGRALV
jgi:hypothetical protein